MTARRVVLLGEEVLRIPTEKIKGFGEETQGLIEDLFDTMYHAGGIGIAAPQIGVSLRICVIDLGRAEDLEESQRLTLINPAIVESSKAKECSIAKLCVEKYRYHPPVEHSGNARTSYHAYLNEKIKQRTIKANECS